MSSLRTSHPQRPANRGNVPNNESTEQKGSREAKGGQAENSSLNGEGVDMDSSSSTGQSQGQSRIQRTPLTERPAYDVPPPIESMPRAPSFSTPPPIYNSDIPEGWERRFDTWGREYFVNHKTKRTQWNHPISQSQAPSVSPLFTPFAEAPYKPPPPIPGEESGALQRMPSFGDAYRSVQHPTDISVDAAAAAPVTPQRIAGAEGGQEDSAIPDSAISTQADSLPASGGDFLTPSVQGTTPSQGYHTRDEEIARSMQSYYDRKSDDSRLRAARKTAKKLGVDLGDVPGISDLDTEDEGERSQSKRTSGKKTPAKMITGFGFDSHDGDLDSVQAFEERGHRLGAEDGAAVSPIMQSASLSNEETAKMDVGEPGICAIIGDTLQHNKCLAISSLFVWIWMGPFIAVVTKALKEGLSAEVLFISILFVVPALSYLVFFILYPMACGDRESPSGDHVHEFMREASVTPIEAAETIEALRNAQPSLEVRVQCYSGDGPTDRSFSDHRRGRSEVPRSQNRRISFERSYPIKILRWFDVSPSSDAYLDALEKSPAVLSSVTYHKVFRVPPGQDELIHQLREELFEIHRHRDDHCDVDLVYLILNARAPYLIRRYLEDSNEGKQNETKSSSHRPNISPRPADPEGAFSISDDYDGEADTTSVFSRNISRIQKLDVSNASYLRRFLTWVFINNVMLWLFTVASFKLPYLIIWKRLVRPFRYYDVKILEIDRNNPIGQLNPVGANNV